MKDINFDELDKAVNSVLQSSKKPEDSKDEPAQTSVATEEATQTEEASAVSQTVVQKRRGQFMDMVHPSSDMTKPESTSPYRRPSQKIEPLSPSIVEADAGRQEAETTQASPVVTEEAYTGPEISVNNEPETEEVEAADTAPRAEIDTSEATAAFVDREWPDPLDVAAETDVEQSDAVVATAEADNGDEGVSEAMLEDPHDSPFIESVDVEKRPLGAFAGEHQEKEADSDTATPEAGEASVGIAEAETIEEEQPADMTESETSAAASIVPQYRPVTEEADTEEHAVFDTEQYHQPLLPEKTKKSHGLLYVLLALLMVGIGAAAGYAIFILKLL
jgi:hypothetical protein